MSDHDDRIATLRAAASEYARVALANISREYPNYAGLGVSGPGEYREPRDRHPAFYGSFDWHSAVEMHWVLVRLLRLVPDAVDGPAIRVALGEHLSDANLRAELAYCAANPGFERPYGWAWYLTLAAELASWDDPDAHAWSRAVTPLAEWFADRFVAWLPRQHYPVRTGLHPNTAFALGRSLAYARQRAAAGSPGTDLLAVLEATARRLFLDDVGYDPAWEPSGSDFLSPGLIEADLVARLLLPERFAAWLSTFLPGLSSQLPPRLARPVSVSDPTDGQGSHLHGLNLSRAWNYRIVSAALPAANPRRPVLDRAAAEHAAAALGAVVGSGYAVEHWLAVYALLYLADELPADHPVSD